MLLGIVLSLFAISNGMSASSQPAPRPNILWIITDDMGVETHAYGIPEMRTPNMDRLAADGAIFTRCFTTAPVCSPSRSALMTGMYQTTINCQDHRSMTELPPGIKPITDYFRDAGYYTANLKKIGPDLISHAKTDFNFHVEKPFDGDDFDVLKGHQPFFAEFQLFEPHRGSWGPARKQQYHVDPAKVTLPPYYPDHPIARKDWAQYLDTIDFLDGKVGTILKLLHEQGLETNTVVFLFGDNGRCHVRDKQWLYEGGLHVPLIVRWPGQIKPGTVRNDLASAIDISATSLSIAGVKLPASMQGRPLIGKQTKQRKYIFGARDRCDETVDKIRSVRDDRFKYIRNYMPDRPYTQPNAYKQRQYPVLALMKQLHEEGKLTPAQELFMTPQKPPEEFYDLKADPDEIHNLASSGHNKADMQRLRKALDEWMNECGDSENRPEAGKRS